MANTKISALPAVATPASTDQFAVNQGGVSKKMTLQQINGAAGGFNPMGTSRLQVNSTTQIQLNAGVIPLLVNSIWQTRVVTGIVVGNGGLSANTTYFVYAFDSAGTLTLEIVATAHTTDATYGVEIKSGDATRTLVGMVRTNASSQFVDTGSTRFIMSWFNRKLKVSVNNSNAQVGTTSATFVELSSSFRAEFLAWADEAVIAAIYGGFYYSNAAAVAVISMGFDGAAAEVGGQRQLGNAAVNPLGISLGGTKSLSEGYHFLTLLGKIDGGHTLTWDSGGGTGDQGAVVVSVRG